MIGSLMVYGHQQWDARGLANVDYDVMLFLYSCMALVKNKENEATEKARKELQQENDRRERER